MFENMTLASKLALGFAIPVFAIVSMSIGTNVVTSSVKDNTNQALSESKESFKFSTLAQNMRLDVVQVQQWLTDISATRGLDGLDDGFDEAENSLQSFLSGLSKFKEMYEEKNERQYINEVKKIQQAFGTYYEAGKTMATAYVKGGAQEGNKFMESFDRAAEALRETIEPFIERQSSKGESALSSVGSSVEKFRMIVSLIGILAVFLSITAAWLITRSITKPVKRFTHMLTEGADQVASAAGQISSASQSLAEGSSEQAASDEQAHGIEQVNSAVTEMDMVTQQNAATGEESASASEEMNAQAEQIRDMTIQLLTMVEGGSNKKANSDTHQNNEMSQATGSLHQMEKSTFIIHQ
ncbi:Methyl-accepting chemotaxis sensor/transducer protein [Olavius sp. associated proteobacterium Delta 1]|nr:Methyl-accepting chemotaxis sensor/transducer protein [Olavius sp. associated proteobacterium Delta 1]